MAGSRAQFRLGPEDNAVRLCTNPQCTNNDPQQFTEKEVCGEDETSTIIQCLVCKEEIPKDDWDYTKMALFKHFGTRTPDAGKYAQDVDQPSDAQKTSLLYDVRRTSSSEIPGLSLDERAGGNVDDVTAAIAELSLPESGHMSREFSTDSIGELISLTPCTTCKEPLVKVSGRDELTVWHCAKCDAVYGVDDSFTMMEMYHTMSLLSESLENATLRYTMCPEGCGNDDPEKFLFDIIDDEVYLICKVCSKPQLIPADNEEKSAPSPQSSEPSPTKSITKIQIQCDCGNDHPEAFAVHYDSSGEPNQLACLHCDKIVVLAMQGRPQSANNVTEMPAFNVRENTTSLAGAVRDIQQKIFAYFSDPKNQEQAMSLVKQYGPEIQKKLQSGISHLEKFVMGAAKDDTKKVVAGVTVSAVGQAAKSVVPRPTSNVVKTPVPKSGAKMGKLGYAGIGLVVTVEAVSTGVDIGRMHEKKKRGDISEKEFVRFTVKRTTQGVSGAAGAIAGGALGQVIIPVPFLGSFVGATLGGYLGDRLGAFTGGNVAEKVVE